VVLDLYIQEVYTRIMTQSTLFKNNKTQAVRLPKALAFPDNVKKVNITQQGDSLIITPIKTSWEEFMMGPRLDADFERLPQPAAEEREEW
jgi:antitoxin VapB